MRAMITGRHIEITPALRDHVETRLRKLERYASRIREVQVVLTVEKYRHTAEVICGLNGVMVQGKTSTREMYSSIDQSVSKILRQIIKRKDKLANHKFRPAAMKAVRAPAPASEKEPKVRTVRPLPPSLTLQEAIARVGQESLPLLLFVEPTSGKLQVLRVLEGGALELIDPQYSASGSN